MTPSDDDAEPPRPGARGILLRILVVLALVVADQWSKQAVFEALEGGPFAVEGMQIDAHGHRRLPVLGEHIGFMLSLNPGAAFGRFGDYPHLLIGGRMIAVALLSWMLVRTRTGDRLGLTALVLVLSGAVGNLVDNLVTGPVSEGHPYGKVRDFIDVWFLSDRFGWDYHFHTFNVADSCITVGAVIWVLAGLLHREKQPAEEAVA